MSYLLELFESIIISGFTITLPVFVLAYYILKQWQVFIKQWLVACYSMLFAYLVVEIIGKTVMIAEQLIIGPKNKLATDFYYFATDNKTLNINLFFSFLLLLSFMLKRVRNSIIFGILALIVIQIDQITLSILSFYREYMPSSWSIYFHFPFNINRYIFCPIAFNLLALLLYYCRKLYLKRIRQAV